MAEPMSNPGFFDVDCRQMTDGNQWGYMPRMFPVKDKLDRLFAFIEENRYTLAAMSCVRANMPQRGSREDMLFIPLDPEDSAWQDVYEQYRMYYLEKKPRCATDPIDRANGPHQVFLHNKNAVDLLSRLDVSEWIVFGNALDACGNLVVEKLLELEYKVVFLSDVMVPGVAAQAEDPEAIKARTYASWREKGAIQLTLDQLLQQCGRKEVGA